MSIAPPTVSLPPTTPGPPEGSDLYRLTVEQYEKMGRAGVLVEDDKVELVNGVLVRKMTKNEPHTASCSDARDCLLKLIPEGWNLRSEAPVRIPQFDEPEPDLAVVRGKSRDYVALNRPPEPAEVALVVEVAESSLMRDRTEKLRAYAHGGIPSYWIINLIDRQVEVYTRPEGDRYAVCQVLKPGQSVTVIVDGVVVGEIAVADLIP